jgi:hypothetical protein
MMTNDVELAAETEPNRWRRVLAEKIETILKIRGLPRPDAEREAFQHVLIEFLNVTHPDTDPTRCAQCGGPETPDAALLPIGCGDRHAWLHRGCWEPWRTRRRPMAEEELTRLGVARPAL